MTEIKIDEAKLKKAKASAQKRMAEKAKAAKKEGKSAAKGKVAKVAKEPKEKKPGYIYLPAKNLDGVKFGVVYEVKGNLLVNSKIHDTEESARWTEKAIRRTGCPVWTVRMEALPAAKPVESK